MLLFQIALVGDNNFELQMEQLPRNKIIFSNLGERMGHIGGARGLLCTQGSLVAGAGGMVCSTRNQTRVSRGQGKPHPLDYLSGPGNKAIFIVVSHDNTVTVSLYALISP